MFQKVDDPWHKTFLQLFDLQIATRIFMACYMMLSFECVTNSWVPQMIVVGNLWMVPCNACMLEPTFYNFVVKPSLHWICYLPNIIVISWNATSSCSWAQTSTSKQHF